jgi:hypothetical protein
MPTPLQPTVALTSPMEVSLLESACDRVDALHHVLDRVHGETNAEPPRLRKVQVFPGSDEHASAVEQLDEKLPLSVPRRRGKEGRQVDTHAKESHTSHTPALARRQRQTGQKMRECGEGEHSHENAGGWLEKLKAAVLQGLLDGKPGAAERGG